VDGATLRECAMDETNLFCTVESTITLHPGANRLRFDTDIPGAAPGHGDSRLLAFRLVNFKVQY
jgi:hypothetical protein